MEAHVKLLQTTRFVTQHPVTTFAMALILIATGVAEAWETIERDIAETNVGAHHGVALFGLISLISVLPDIFEGLERLIGPHKDKGAGSDH